MRDTSRDKTIDFQTKRSLGPKLTAGLCLEGKPNPDLHAEDDEKVGLYSSKERVCFSADLLQEPRTFQEYVNVHEFLHLKVPNHGRLFKSLMKAYLSDWEAILAERNGRATRSL